MPLLCEGDAHAEYEFGGEGGYLAVAAGGIALCVRVVLLYQRLENKTALCLQCVYVFADFCRRDSMLPITVYSMFLLLV